MRCGHGAFRPVTGHAVCPELRIRDFLKMSRLRHTRVGLSLVRLDRLLFPPGAKKKENDAARVAWAVRSKRDVFLEGTKLNVSWEIQFLFASSIDYFHEMVGSWIKLVGSIQLYFHCFASFWWDLQR